jgi:DNA-binding CsgD family transcriptional regulator
MIVDESPVVSSGDTTHLIGLDADWPALAALLTPREREVLGLIAQGFTDRRIAEALRISPLTATTHVKRILRKLQVPSRSAAAAIAVRNELRATGKVIRYDLDPAAGMRSEAWEPGLPGRVIGRPPAFLSQDCIKLTSASMIRIGSGIMRRRNTG